MLALRSLYQEKMMAMTEKPDFETEFNWDVENGLDIEMKGIDFDFEIDFGIDFEIDFDFNDFRQRTRDYFDDIFDSDSDSDSS